MTWHDAGEGYYELREGSTILAAFGPNPYGMMGQDWYRGWTFDPATTNATGTMVWAPRTNYADMRADLEKAVNGGATYT